MKGLKIAVLLGVPLSCVAAGLAYVYWGNENFRDQGILALRAAFGLTFLTLLCAFTLALNTDTGPDEEDFESF